MHDVWPWVTLAGLGAFHGINPAMGWLFAVALGQLRDSQRVVVMSLFPIAAGHMLAIGLVVATVLAAGAVLDLSAVRVIGGAILIGWAVYHILYGHRHRVRFGMRTGMLGLMAWSFLMASAHGAGLMLVPVLIPLGLAGMPAHHMHMTETSLAVASAAVGLHTLAMLVTMGAIAILVFRWLGLEFLKRAWFNIDVLWVAALIGAGAFLILS